MCPSSQGCAQRDRDRPQVTEMCPKPWESAPGDRVAMGRAAGSQELQGARGTRLVWCLSLSSGKRGSRTPTPSVSAMLGLTGLMWDGATCPAPTEGVTARLAARMDPGNLPRSGEEQLSLAGMSGDVPPGMALSIGARGGAQWGPPGGASCTSRCRRRARRLLCRNRSWGAWTARSSVGSPGRGITRPRSLSVRIAQIMSEASSSLG